MTSSGNGWRVPGPGPRIESLRADLRATSDVVQTLGEFWREVEDAGTPLVAPIPGDDQGVAVTFLWRDADPAVEHVALGPSLVLFEQVVNVLRRIEGTDVFHLTLRLPRDTRVTYALGPNDSLDGIYPLITLYDDAAREWAESPRGRRDWLRDPLNDRVWPRPDSWVATHHGALGQSLLDLAPDADQEIVSWLTATPVRDFTEHRMHSAILGEERGYRIYLPDEPVANVIWTFDGEMTSVGAPLQPIVEALVEAGRIGPTAIVFINGPQWSRSKELILNPSYADFVRDELVPEVRRHWALPLDPAANVITGFSAGGLASAFLALRAPSIFGKALLEAPGLGVAARGHEPRELFDWYRYRLPAPTTTKFAITAGMLEVDRIIDAPSIWDAVAEFVLILRDLGCEVSVRTGPYGHDSLGWRIQTAKALPDLIGAPR